jgi:hypothetical protein
MAVAAGRKAVALFSQRGVSRGVAFGRRAAPPPAETYASAAITFQTFLQGAILQQTLETNRTAFVTYDNSRLGEAVALGVGQVFFYHRTSSGRQQKCFAVRRKRGKQRCALDL